MDKDVVINKFEWFCNQIGGKFRSERVYNMDILYCTGINKDLHCDMLLDKGDMKTLHLSSEDRGVELHLNKNDELNLETILFARHNIQKVKSLYNKENAYTLGSMSVDVKNVQKIELRVYKNTLDCIIS